MPKKKEKKRCQYKGWGVEPCPYEYFATYTDPETDEETDFCIFHAPMELKDEGEFIKQFWEAFDAYFDETNARYEAELDEEKKKGIRLDCEGFVFPYTGDNFWRRNFMFNVSFLLATFRRGADFWEATFERVADFGATVFTSEVSFRGTNFEREAHFTGTTFTGKADFTAATFAGEAHFMGADLKGGADFLHTSFEREVFFSGATFERGADFRWATFSDVSHFKEATLSGEGYFEDATFKLRADFRKLILTGRAGFGGIEFSEPISFEGSCICGEVKFPDTVFLGKADFRGIKMYLVDNEGKRTDPDAAPGVLLFDNTYFDQPERIQLGGKETDLGQWSLKDTNVENVNFVNEEWKLKRRYWIDPFKRLALFIGRKFKRDWEPKWRWRDKYEVVNITKSLLWLFRRKGRKVIYDEILANEDKDKRDPEKRVT